MKYPTRIIQHLMIGIAALGVTAAASAGEIAAGRISLQVSQAIPFPKALLGAQDEIWELPFVTNEEWARWSKSGLSMLRYPSGTPSDWFLWDSPDKSYWPNDYVSKRKKIHPDEFLAQCRKFNITPMITVNTSSYGYPGDVKRINPMRVESIRKGAEYAAKWVHDVNVKKKQNVRYWEVGNEVWVWLKPEENAQIVREYAAQMRAVDPSIKIIACGLNTDQKPYYVTWLNFPDDPKWEPRYEVNNNAYEWTRALLQDAPGSYDYIAIHHYFTGASADPIENGKDIFSQVVEFRSFENVTRWMQESKSNARIAVTEWMMNFRWDPVFRDHFEKQGYPEAKTLTYENSPAFCFFNTLAAADFLGKMGSSNIVDIAIAHTVRDGLFRRWDSKNGKAINPPVAAPAGVALSFWGEFAGDRIVPVMIDKSEFYMYRGVRIPYVATYATMKGDHTMNLILINRSPTVTASVSLPTSIDNRPIKQMKEHAVAAESWSTSMWSAVADPAKQPFRRTDRDLEISKSSNYSLKPSQLICIEMSY